jgi:hypothetical protein
MTGGTPWLRRGPKSPEADPKPGFRVYRADLGL